LSKGSIKKGTRYFNQCDENVINSIKTVLLPKIKCRYTYFESRNYMLNARLCKVINHLLSNAVMIMELDSLKYGKHLES